MAAHPPSRTNELRRRGGLAAAGGGALERGEQGGIGGLAREGGRLPRCESDRLPKPRSGEALQGAQRRPRREAAPSDASNALRTSTSSRPTSSPRWPVNVRWPPPTPFATSAAGRKCESATALADRWVAELNAHGASRAAIVASVPGGSKLRWPTPWRATQGASPATSCSNPTRDAESREAGARRTRGARHVFRPCTATRCTIHASRASRRGGASLAAFAGPTSEKSFRPAPLAAALGDGDEPAPPSVLAGR